MVGCVAACAVERDLLDGFGGFEGSKVTVSNAALPEGWTAVSGSSPSQQLSYIKGNHSKRALLFTKTGNEFGLFHRIAYKLTNILIPKGTVITLSFDYYCDQKDDNLTAGFGVGLSRDGGSGASFMGDNNYIEGVNQILTKENIKTGEWITVTKTINLTEPLRNPCVMLCENYWDKLPYQIAIDNVKLLVDGGLDMRAIKSESICMSDERTVPSSDWTRGEEYGAKMDIQIKPLGSSGVSVAYNKDAGGGYCTIAKTLDKPFDLMDFKTVILDADFTRNTEPTLRNINNEGHSGIALWIQDDKGKKAYFDVYSIVPIAKNKFRYYYLLEYPLGPFNGMPDRTNIKSFGLQVSKIDRAGRGGFDINDISVLMKHDLGDKEIGKLYMDGVTKLSNAQKPIMGNYYVLTGSANVKYRITYLPTGKITQIQPPITLSSARQATAHSQIVFVPSLNAKNMKVTLRAGELVSTKHLKVIPAADMKVMAVGHVSLRPNKIPTKYAGWYPDIVFNSNILTLTKDKTQCAWVQINVPAGIPADIYSGKIDILGTDNKRLYSIPIKLKVWDFDLPKDNKIRTSFWAFRGMVAKFEGKPEIKVEEMYPYYKLALDHRISPIDQNDGIKPLYTIYREKDNSLTIDATEFEKYLSFCKRNSNGAFNAFNIAEHAWFGANLQSGFNVIDRETGKIWIYDKSPFSSENKRIFKTAIDKLCDIAEKRGLLKYAYIQPFDEPSPNEPMFPKIISAMKEMKLRVPIEVVFAVNQSIDYYPEMTKDIDIWTPSLYTLRESDIAYQHGRNREIWSYVCSGGNPLIPNKPNHDRWFFLQNFKMGATGFLNWGLNYWGNPTKEQWNNGIYDGYGNYDNSASGQGDGVLMYPGANPSIRLKGLMRGVEDYQYVWLLKLAYLKNSDTIIGKSVSKEVEDLLSMDKLMLQIQSGSENCIDKWREEVASVIMKLR